MNEEDLNWKAKRAKNAIHMRAWLRRQHLCAFDIEMRSNSDSPLIIIGYADICTIEFVRYKSNTEVENRQRATFYALKINNTTEICFYATNRNLHKIVRLKHTAKVPTGRNWESFFQKQNNILNIFTFGKWFNTFTLTYLFVGGKSFAQKSIEAFALLLICNTISRKIIDLYLHQSMHLISSICNEMSPFSSVHRGKNIRQTDCGKTFYSIGDLVWWSIHELLMVCPQFRLKSNRISLNESDVFRKIHFRA